MQNFNKLFESKLSQIVEGFVNPDDYGGGMYQVNKPQKEVMAITQEDVTASHEKFPDRAGAAGANGDGRYTPWRELVFKGTATELEDTVVQGFMAKGHPIGSDGKKYYHTYYIMSGGPAIEIGFPLQAILKDEDVLVRATMDYRRGLQYGWTYDEDQIIIDPGIVYKKGVSQGPIEPLQEFHIRMWKNGFEQITGDHDVGRIIGRRASWGDKPGLFDKWQEQGKAWEFLVDFEDDEPSDVMEDILEKDPSSKRYYVRGEKVDYSGNVLGTKVSIKVW